MGDFESQAPVAVYCSADQAGTFGFFNRDRFTGQHALIHIALTFDDHTVSGDTLTRMQQDSIATHQFLHRYFCELSVPQYARGFRTQPDQGSNSRAGFTFGPCLHPATHENKNNDHSSSFEIDRLGFRRKDHWSKQNKHGIEICGHGSHGDETVHVGSAPDKCRKPVLIEGSAGTGQYCGCQDGLNDPTGRLADSLMNQVVERGHHMSAHFQYKNRQRQNDGPEHVLTQGLHLSAATVLRGKVIVLCHACRETRAFNSRDQCGSQSVLCRDRCCFCREVDRNLFHTGHRRQGAIYASHTGPAVHFLHRQCDSFRQDQTLMQVCTLHKGSSHWKVKRCCRLNCFGSARCRFLVIICLLRLIRQKFHILDNIFCVF